jgi:hypothetical protein
VFLLNSICHPISLHTSAIKNQHLAKLFKHLA